MDNLILAAPELPARINLGRRRTGAPRPANDNGGVSPAAMPVAIPETAPAVKTEPAAAPPRQDGVTPD